MLIIEGVAITAQMDRLLTEAQRRYVTFAIRDRDPLNTAWIGLGVPSYYRPATSAGVMIAFNGETPRILNWYLFTDLGLRVFAGWLATKSYNPRTDRLQDNYQLVAVA